MSVSNPDAIPSLPPEVQAEVDAGTQAVVKGHSDKVLARLDAEVAAPAAEPETDPLAAAEAQIAEVAKPKPVEKPKDEPPKDEDRIGQLAQSLKKAQAKLAAEKQAFTRQREEITQRETRANELLKQQNQVLGEFRADPIAWAMRYAGLNEEMLAARLLNKGAPSPQELTKQWDERYKTLESELKAEKEARATEKAAIARENALQQFVSAAKAGEERWPLASKWSEPRLRAEGMRIANEMKAAGTPLDDEGILDQIEERLSEIAALRGSNSNAAPSRTAVKTGASVRQTPPKTQPAPTLAQSGSDGANEAEEPDPDKLVELMRDKEGYARYMAGVARRVAKANGLKRTGIDT